MLELTQQQLQHVALRIIGNADQWQAPRVRLKADLQRRHLDIHPFAGKAACHMSAESAPVITLQSVDSHGLVPPVACNGRIRPDRLKPRLHTNARLGIDWRHSAAGECRSVTRR
jgi:hypothetical protein